MDEIQQFQWIQQTNLIYMEYHSQNRPDQKASRRRQNQTRPESYDIMNKKHMRRQQ